MKSLLKKDSRNMRNIKRKLVFKDQPDGDCLSCTWNAATEADDFHCLCPIAKISNRICIAKRQLVTESNVYDVLNDYE